MIGAMGSPLQRQYQMDHVGEASQVEAIRTLPAQARARPGQSGEGARSALEHLLQQESRRAAQSPRDGGGAEGASSGSAPASPGAPGS